MARELAPGRDHPAAEVRCRRTGGGIFENGAADREEEARQQPARRSSAKTYAMLWPSSLSTPANVADGRVAHGTFAGQRYHELLFAGFDPERLGADVASVSPSIFASVPRDASHLRQVGALACNVQRSPSARTGMRPACI